ncbi:DUF5694 domain-containing protein [Undibacterium cyanobacteriorum]|uniref:DUF5694 domain-containing protein n=1 Tax=Undibacterium cyanobacteriorum TaxID=3073561 RepID=A0ABY9REL4_9BURK|nr:DUF5694 domain-containing protein [Undibacterium sp. 20NA77.5]WMW79673.1 DUF5694 domain-containing protein [Undibacterium sp. 20NA77.5]
MKHTLIRTALVALMVPVALSIACSAVAQTKFEPNKLKGPKQGPMNQVFVLGTPHLSEFSKDFSASHLRLVVEKMEAWKPEIIAIEKISGVQCDHMKRYQFRYADTVKSYCPDTSDAQRATGLDVPAATAEIEKQLPNLSKEASAAQRRHLAALFLAAGEGPSALVQWLKLAESERRVGDGIDDALMQRLEKMKTSMNENIQIAVPLAVRLGLERIYSVDDHTADSGPSSAEDEKGANEAISKAWNNTVGAKRRIVQDKLEKLTHSPEEVLQMYRGYNSTSLYPLIFGSDFGAAMNEGSSKHYGRQYLGYWETRNLRMVSNIRDVMGMAPGKRTLAIVGVSHKPYYEAYLDMMHDVKVHVGDTLLK